MQQTREDFVVVDSAGHTMIDVEALRAAEQREEGGTQPDDESHQGR